MYRPPHVQEFDARLPSAGDDDVLMPAEHGGEADVDDLFDDIDENDLMKSAVDDVTWNAYVNERTRTAPH